MVKPSQTGRTHTRTSLTYKGHMFAFFLTRKWASFSFEHRKKKGQTDAEAESYLAVRRQFVPLLTQIRIPHWENFGLEMLTRCTCLFFLTICLWTFDFSANSWIPLRLNIFSLDLVCRSKVFLSGREMQNKQRPRLKSLILKLLFKIDVHVVSQHAKSCCFFFLLESQSRHKPLHLKCLSSVIISGKKKNTNTHRNTVILIYFSLSRWTNDQGILHLPVVCW